MKKAINTVFTLLLVIGFTSCQTSEGIEGVDVSAKLLKSYSVKRDASGSYSLDYKLANGTAAESVQENNTNQVNLYASDFQSRAINSQDLNNDNGNMNIEFVNTDLNTKSQITIIDDQIYTKEAIGRKFLSDYSITKNENGTFQLDFNVKKNVAVSFTYNKVAAVYEIHLEKGKATTATFSRTFTNENGEDLKVDFVNHLANNFARTEAAQPRKPRMIIQGGE